MNVTMIKNDPWGGEMNIYFSADIRKIDEESESQGFNMFSLMENAGRGIFEKIESLLTKKDRIIILCGRGNNGGDGIVIARYLLQTGYNVSLVFPLGEPKTETAKAHLEY